MSQNRQRENQTQDRVLPAGWAWTTLGEVNPPTRETVQPANFPELQYLSLEHVEAQTMKILGSAPASTLKSAALKFYAGDVLYGRMRPYLNKVAQPDFEGLCSPEFITFRKQENLDSRYFRYFINANWFKNFATHATTGDRPRVDWDQLKNYEFPLAPLNEQKRIAAKLDEAFTELDAGLGQIASARRKLKAYRASVLDAAITGRLSASWRKSQKTEESETAPRLLRRVLQERRARWEADLRAKDKDPAKIKYPEPAAPNVADLPPVPKGWCWASLEQLTSRVTDGTHQPPRFVAAGVPFLFIKHIVGGSITFENTKFISKQTYEALNARCPVEMGDILYSAVGSYGVAVVVETEKPFSFQRHIAHIKPIKLLSSSFLALCLNSPTGLAQAHKVARGVAQKTVTLGDLTQFVLPLPPLAEQKFIVAEVERCLSLVAEAEGVLDASEKRAKSLRASILEKAFRGELAPQDPTDESAEVLLSRIANARQAEQKRQAEAKKQKPKSPARPRAPHGGKTMNATIKPLREVLLAGGGTLSPEELFAQAGYSAQTVDEFFLALRNEIGNGIEQKPKRPKGSEAIALIALPEAENGAKGKA